MGRVLHKIALGELMLKEQGYKLILRSRNTMIFGFTDGWDDPECPRRGYIKIKTDSGDSMAYNALKSDDNNRTPRVITRANHVAIDWILEGLGLFSRSSEIL